MALPPEHHLPPFVTTDISSISLALLVLGAYVCLVGQVSYFLKERLFMSSALISICLGIGELFHLRLWERAGRMKAGANGRPRSGRTYWTQLDQSLDMDWIRR